MGKITNFMIALSLVFLIFGSIGTYMGMSVKEYNVTNFDNEDFQDTYNKLENINNISEKIRTKADTKVQNNPFDVLGTYFVIGYESIRLTLTSVDIMDQVTKDAIDDLDYDEGASTKTSGNLKMFLMTIIVIIIVFGVIIGIVVNRDV